MTGLVQRLREMFQTVLRLFGAQGRHAIPEAYDAQVKHQRSPWRLSRPFAYHVFPLHFARDIWRTGSLLSKKARKERGLSNRNGRARESMEVEEHTDMTGLPVRVPRALNERPTTAGVDVELGFDDVVHLYLPLAKNPPIPPITPIDLPILKAQLGPAKLPPFPHAVLRVPIETLEHLHFHVCCWNIGVGRPSCVSANVRGGNWTRGTDPKRTAEVWNAFRDEQPDIERARGEWIGTMKVPVLTAKQLELHSNLMRSRPELLVPSTLPLGPTMTVTVFSPRDEKLLGSLGTPPGDLKIERATFPGYEEQEVAMTDTYDHIERYLGGGETTTLHFDRDRSKVAASSPRA